MNINKDRIVAEFRSLVEIDSESLNEREMADVLKVMLRDLGFEVEEDDAGSKINGNAGNIYAYLKGDPSRPSILLSGHMDTVKPGIGKEAILHDDGKITSKGDTVLGGDDLTGVVGILEGIRLALDSEKPVGDIEILFSVCEEIYGKGAAIADYDKIKSKIAYALDLSGAPGEAAIKAPSIVSFTSIINGKAAHSGFEPEKGVHALKAAANAISKIQLGHVPGDMTVNVGTISAGKANNIVPEVCVSTGEVRGFDHEKVLEKVAEIESIFREEAMAIGATAEFSHEVNIMAFNISEDEEVCTRFKTACSNLGLPGNLVSTHGGSDNAFFVEKGIRGIVLSCGMYNVHSVDEYTYADDLVMNAKLVSELLTV